MSDLDHLIRIYARHTVSEIASDPDLLQNNETGFGVTVQELAARPGFSAEQAFVQRQKQAIEAERARYSVADNATQISECLKELLRVAIYDDSAPATVTTRIDVLRGLFREMYADRWSAAQRDHFDFVADCLREWHTYFLSYTNAGAPIVNGAYNTVIRRFADPQVRKRRNRDTDNILADAIVHALERRRLSRRSFYDKDKIGPGDNLEATIGPAATRTLAFLQLVQLETFATPQAQVNWSFKEYELFNRYNEEQLKQHPEYRNVFETRFIAILAGERKKIELADSAVPDQYREWKKRVFDTAHFVELPVSAPRFEEIIMRLEQAIIERAYSIIESVPASQ